MKHKVLIAKIAIWLLALRPLLIFLLLSLSMTPIRLLTKQTWVIQLRRLLGLWMFAYASFHVIAYVWFDFGFLFDEMLIDITEHPRIWLGLIAFILAIPLAVTSNNYMMRRLKTKWKALHKLVYPLAILAVMHFLWLVKKDLTEPIYYAIVLFLLFAIRIYYNYLKPIK